MACFLFPWRLGLVSESEGDIGAVLQLISLLVTVARTSCDTLWAFELTNPDGGFLKVKATGPSSTATLPAPRSLLANLSWPVIY